MKPQNLVVFRGLWEIVPDRWQLLYHGYLSCRCNWFAISNSKKLVLCWYLCIRSIRWTGKNGQILYFGAFFSLTIDIYNLTSNIETNNTAHWPDIYSVLCWTCDHLSNLCHNHIYDIECWCEVHCATIMLSWTTWASFPILWLG